MIFAVHLNSKLALLTEYFFSTKPLINLTSILDSDVTSYL